MQEKSDSSTSQKSAHIAVALVIGLVLLLFLSRGCGTQGPVEVYGRVLQDDGKVLPTGRIFFTPTANTDGPAAGGRITDGKFRIAFDGDTVIGEYDVRVTTGEPGPPGGGGRLAPETPPERSVSYCFTRILTESTREQEFMLDPEAKRKRPSR